MFSWPYRGALRPRRRDGAALAPPTEKNRFQPKIKSSLPEEKNFTAPMDCANRGGKVAGGCMEAVISYPRIKTITNKDKFV